jgi:hypothetical protein
MAFRAQHPRAIRVQHHNGLYRTLSSCQTGLLSPPGTAACHRASEQRPEGLAERLKWSKVVLAPPGNHCAAGENQRPARDNRAAWRFVECDPGDQLRNQEEQRDINAQELPEIPLRRVYGISVAEKTIAPVRNHQARTAPDARSPARTIASPPASKDAARNSNKSAITLSRIPDESDSPNT